MSSLKPMDAFVMIALLLIGCAGGEGERPDAAAEGQPAVEAQPATETPAGAGQVDESLASAGEALMQSKGCAACHTIGGGRLVGPDLQGVTQRRSEGYIIGMIVNPDSMLVNDETAKQLLAEYFTPMTNMGVTEADARALLAYLRQQDAE